MHVLLCACCRQRANRTAIEILARAEYLHLSSGYAGIVGFDCFQEWLCLPSRHCWMSNHARTFKPWHGSLSRHRARSRSMNASASSLNKYSRPTLRWNKGLDGMHKYFDWFLRTHHNRYCKRCPFTHAIFCSQFNARTQREHHWRAAKQCPSSSQGTLHHCGPRHGRTAAKS